MSSVQCEPRKRSDASEGEKRSQVMFLAAFSVLTRWTHGRGGFRWDHQSSPSRNGHPVLSSALCVLLHSQGRVASLRWVVIYLAVV